jgi:hypothetical protein
MSNEMYERLLERCGPILRRGSTASTPLVEDVTNNYNSSSTDQQQAPPPKGILKKSPLVLKLKVGGPVTSSHHAEPLPEGDDDKVEDDEHNRLVCDLCHSAFRHSMALKQHKRFVTFFVLYSSVIFAGLRVR